MWACASGEEPSVVPSNTLKLSTGSIGGFEKGKKPVFFTQVFNPGADCFFLTPKVYGILGGSCLFSDLWCSEKYATPAHRVFWADKTTLEGSCGDCNLTAFITIPKDERILS